LPETAQILIEGKPKYRELRDEVKLEKGGQVDVTVTAESKPKLIEKL
jgi:hypothetical protein